MIKAKDYHKVLGVSKKASKDEIQKAYRRLAMQYHPDRNREPKAEERFKEINEAYAILSGKERPIVETSSRPDGSPRMGAYDEWAESVVKRWGEMLNDKQNNMYR